MELKQHLDCVAGELDSALACDVALLSGDAAATLLLVVSSLENRLASLRLALGHRAVECNVHLRTGARDGATWLASATGQSVGAARAELQTAERLDSLPDLSSAAAAGELSVTQLHHVTLAGAADPSRQTDLIQAAHSSSIVGLKKVCQEVLGTQPSPEAEAEHWNRMQQRRFLRVRSEADGMVSGEFRLMPDDGAQFLAKLKPFVERSFRAARAEGRHESHERYAADGFATLVDTSGDGVRRARAEVVVIASYEALVRGHAQAGERCGIEGVGPIPVTLAKSLAEDCFLSALVVRDGKPVMAVGKGHYIPNRLRVAVHVRDRCCVVPGCNSDFRLEIDHIVPVEKRGPTALDNLRLFCKSHHDMRTHKGFDIVVDDDGRSTWVQLHPARSNPWSKTG